MHPYYTWTRQGNRIEYFKFDGNRQNIPLVLSMGNWEPAFRGFRLLERINDRSRAVLSYRGRGGSESPESGYDWRDHAYDLEAVVDDCSFDKCIFVSFSKGVSYTLAYLENHPEKAAGIVLIDYPPIHCASEPGYADFWYTKIYKDFRLQDHVTEKTLKGIEVESTPKDFSPLIAQLPCPVTLFIGTDGNAPIGSNVSPGDLAALKIARPDIRIVEFPKSGHMILDDQPEEAARELKKFIGTI